jgi:hypothetical protein
MSIYIYTDFIFKKLSEDSENYIGYDILTEQFIKINKKEPFCLIGKSIKNLLSSEIYRIRLAMQIEPRTIKGCELLGVTDRTFLRLRQQHYDNNQNTTVRLKNSKKHINK